MPALDPSPPPTDLLLTSIRSLLPVRSLLLLDRPVNCLPLALFELLLFLMLSEDAVPTTKTPGAVSVIGIDSVITIAGPVSFLTMGCCRQLYRLGREDK